MNSLYKRLASDLSLQEEYIKSIVRKSNICYKTYHIPKRNGGVRFIHQASPELKTLQYWVREKVLVHLPVSRAAFAYEPECSIRKHADYHRQCHFLFHTDVKNFFPSIQQEHLECILKAHRSILEEHGVWYEDLCYVVGMICFRNNGLSIGTVSSPRISNIIMYDFDEKLLEYCEAKGYHYSRYADDIYISSPTYIPVEVQDLVEAALKEKGFSTNSQKTGFRTPKARRKVTGVIITDQKTISIGSAFKRDIRSMIYQRLKYGQGDPEVILGYLSFLKAIEPATFTKYLIKYAPYCNGNVLAAIKRGIQTENEHDKS